MRQLTPALSTHIAQEVISLTECIEIERADGFILRLTAFNKDLVVAGETYLSGGSFNLSAIRSTTDLAVDNASLDIGLDEVLTLKAAFDADLYRRAQIRLFNINWQAPDDGTIELKRGWIGDVVIRDSSYVTIQLRGLAQALQRNVLEFYSPTCRAEFGDNKCSMAITPTQVHRPGGKYKTGDWVVKPATTTLTTINGSFDADGVVADGTSGISAWTYGPNSSWQTSNALIPHEGGYYLQGGTNAAPSLTIFKMSQTLSATMNGLISSNIDAGDYAYTFAFYASSPSAVKSDTVRAVLELLDANQVVLRRYTSAFFKPEFGIWEEISISGFVVPKTRYIRTTIEAKKTTGSLDVIIDDVRNSLWFATSAAYDDVVYKAVRIPGFKSNEALSVSNYRFAVDGVVSNGENDIDSWETPAGSFWRIVNNLGVLQPYDGAFFLVGGNNGTSTPGQVYEIEQENTEIAAVLAAAPTGSAFLAELHIAMTNIAADSHLTAELEFLNASGVLIGSTVASPALTSAALDSWEIKKFSAAVPALAATIRYRLIATSGASSSADVAVGSVKLYLMNTLVASVSDAAAGRAGDGSGFIATPGAYSYDGGVLWLAQAASFGYDAVSDVVDNRSFKGTAISGGDYDYYGARIVWLSGNNAGTISYVRTWLSPTKDIKMYLPTAQPIVAGDKFIYSKGCAKTIADCSTRFNNSINFRGEPYLPGPEKVLKFFSNV